MRNPFEISQYSANITSGGIFDPASGGMLGVDYIMRHLQDAIMLRQRAVKDAFKLPIPFSPVNVSSIAVDTPTAVYESSLILRSALLQFISGHSSREYERIVLKETCTADSIEPNGFFQKTSYDGSSYSPSEGYYYNINDLIGGEISTFDVDIIANPPVFGSDSYPTMMMYARAQGAWANSFIKFLNKLSYIHKSLVMPYVNATCLGENGACSFNYSLLGSEVTQSWSDNPIEIILDISDSLVCGSNVDSGYICLSFSSLVGKHRVVVLPTLDRSSIENTNLLRSKLFGFQEVGIAGTPYGGGDATPAYGYLDTVVYPTLASLPVRFDVSGSGIQCPVSPLADSSCINTSTQFPPAPWRRQGSTAKVCIPINRNMFSTVDDADDGWRYKVRVIVFPNCSISTPSMNWSLALNCMDCTCDDVLCGGDNPPPTGSSRSICTFNQSRSGPGLVTVHDYILDVDASLQCPPSASGGKICLRFKTNQGSVAPDRLYVLRTWYPPDHDIDLGFTSVNEMINTVRSPLFGASGVDMTGFDLAPRTETGYYSNTFYSQESLQTKFGNNGNSIFNPYFSVPPAGSAGSTSKNCPPSAIMVDSGCVHSSLPNDFVPFDPALRPVDWCYDNGTGSFIACFDITSSCYSNDINDAWYRKLRVIVFDDCSGFGVAAWTASTQCLNCACTLCPCDPYPSSSSSSSSSSSKITPSSSSSSENFSSSSSSENSSSSSSMEPPPPSSSSSPPDPCAGLAPCPGDPPGCDGADVDISNLCSICWGLPCPVSVIIPANEFCALMLGAGCYDRVFTTCCSGGQPVTIEVLVSSGAQDCVCGIVRTACINNCGNQCIGFGCNITMADGSKKRAEELRVGDVLLSVDFGINPDYVDLFDKYIIPSNNHWKYSTTTVTSIKYGFESSHYLINDRLKLTYEHPILIKHEGNTFFRSVSAIKNGENGYDESLEEVDLNINKIDKPIVTVRINTEHNDWFFAEGVLVHNDEIGSDTGLSVSDPINFVVEAASSSSSSGPVTGSSSSSKILVNG